MVSWLSQGSTLLPGDLIFTGSPEGNILIVKFWPVV